MLVNCSWAWPVTVECGCYTQRLSTGEIWLSLSWLVSIVNMSLVRDETLCVCLFLCVRSLSGSNLCRAVHVTLSWWIHICFGPVVFGRHCLFGVTHRFWLWESFTSFSASIPGPWGQRFDEDIPSMNECSEIFYSMPHFLGMGVNPGVNSYPLQENAPLMGTEWGTNLCV